MCFRHTEIPIDERQERRDSSLLNIEDPSRAESGIPGLWERNANVQELSEASDQPIEKPDLALKDSLSGVSQ